MRRPYLVIGGLLAAGCHHAAATGDPGSESTDASGIDAPAAVNDAKPDATTQSNRPEVTLTGTCPQPAPTCRRQNPDGTCTGEQMPVCADAFWLCPPGTSPSATCSPHDAAADVAPEVGSVFGCPAGCPAGQICVIPGYFRGDNRGGCAAPPPQCPRDGGSPDAGAGCDQCVGFAVCRGAFGCLTAPTVTYTCGI